MNKISLLFSRQFIICLLSVVLLLPANDVYSESNLSFEYIGCFRDMSVRDIDSYTMNSPDMTTEKCIELCDNRGDAYAATQFGQHCFCGNTYGKYGPATNCNMSCAGNAAQVCGGGWANSVYKINAVALSAVTDISEVGIASESDSNWQAAQSYWDQARQYQADGDYPLALKYYRQGLNLWSDEQILDRAKRLESFLMVRGQSQSEETFEQFSDDIFVDSSSDLPSEIRLSQIQGYLESNQKDHHHTIEMSHYGTLDIDVQSESSLTIWMQLFDDQGNRLGNTNASTHLEIIRQDLAPGSYNLQIVRSAGQGGYEINPIIKPSQFKNDVEPNNLKEEAQTIALGNITQGLLGYLTRGTLDSQDWFSFETTEFGEISIKVEGEESLLFWMQLLDIDGNRLGNTSASSSLELTRGDQAPGTYFVQLIRSGGYGGYEITPELSASMFASDHEPNNVKNEAQTIDLGGATQGLLGYVSRGTLDSQDWFSFETTEFGEISVKVEGEESLQFWMQLLDIDGNRLGNTSASSSLELTRGDQAPGTYFVQLIRSGGYGGYEITPEHSASKFVSDHEPNNVKNEAQLIDIEEVTQGLLGYLKRGTLDSQDWFTFEITEIVDLNINVEAEESLQFWMQLFDADGNRLGNTSASSSLELHRPNVEPGSYYIQLIRSSGHGGYTIQF
ncbi:MAG: hypothetical protein EA373_04530 [Oceanospirillales bacterium]|nr:MAG: hypothetical protein EA373_04530 [Oceanospirillales bacterium]